MTSIYYALKYLKSCITAVIPCSMFQLFAEQIFSEIKVIAIPRNLLAKKSILNFRQLTQQPRDFHKVFSLLLPLFLLT